jgi:purine-nucleoside phosphorylase
MRYEEVEEAGRSLLDSIPGAPTTALVLGSGLAGLRRLLPSSEVVEYGDIPYFPRTTVGGHEGRIHAGVVGGTNVLILSGRVHYYEGHDMDRVTFPIRLLGQIGTKEVLLTNAAGSINPAYKPGELMLIRDHINLTGANPLRGANEERWGPRFVDQTEVYDSALRGRLREAAQAESVELKEGVYLAVAGPTYETPAEISAFRNFGADAVGMSTVPEAIVARHMGMRVAGISVLSNSAAQQHGDPITHQEVLDAGQHVQETLGRMLRRFLEAAALRD